MLDSKCPLSSLTILFDASMITSVTVWNWNSMGREDWGQSLTGEQ